MSQQMPVNTGRVDGGSLVVPECTLCGEIHYHGAPVDGISETTRAPHCHPEDLDGELPLQYRIVVSGGGSE